MAFYSFGLWNMLGLGGRAIELKTQIDEYNQNREILETLNEGVNESKTKERSPIIFERNIKDVVDGTSRERVYIPVRRWQNYWQDQGVDPQEVTADRGVEKRI